MIYKNTASTLNEMRLVIQAEREVEERFYSVLEKLSSDITPDTMRKIFDLYTAAKNVRD